MSLETGGVHFAPPNVGNRSSLLEVHEIGFQTPAVQFWPDGPVTGDGRTMHSTGVLLPPAEAESGCAEPALAGRGFAILVSIVEKLHLGALHSFGGCLFVCFGLWLIMMCLWVTHMVLPH